MDTCQFNNIVLEHRNTILLIGGIILIIGMAAMLFIEFYVRGMLGCKYFQIKKHKFSPTLLMLIPITAVLICCAVNVGNCNADIADHGYETYVGVCEYETESVALVEEGITIYVGKGHEIVPRGTNYGKCVYSKRAKVIVYWEPALPDV